MIPGPGQTHLLLASRVRGGGPQADGHPQATTLMPTLEPPTAFSFLLGAIVMIGGVLLPLGYVFVKNKRALMKGRLS